MRRWLPRFGGVLILSMAATPVAAQRQGPLDTLLGRVLQMDSLPIALARVSATVDGATWSGVTDTLGVFRLLVPRGTSPVTLRASAFGYVPLTRILARAGAQGPYEAWLKLNPQPIELRPVSVRAPIRHGERPSVGETAQRPPAFTNESYPVDAGDLTALAGLQPGVLRVGGGVSLAGQSPEQNRTTVDGAGYGGSALPSEGVRSTGVIGTTYDVSRGGFSGGQLTATTLGGTNTWGGALTGRVDDPHLAYGGTPASAALSPGRQGRLSGGGGGALVRDRLFVYGAADLVAGDNSSAGLFALDAASLGQLELAADSVQRFLAITRRLGIAGASGGERRLRSANAILRLDYQMGESQSLMVRLNGSAFRSSGLGLSPWRLSSALDRVGNDAGGVLVQLSSVRGSWVSETRASMAGKRSWNDAGVDLPVAGVLVQSDLGGGAIGNSMLSFGGLQLPPAQGGVHWELAQDLTRYGRRHRLQAGILFQADLAHSDAPGNPYGSFLFDGLHDLESGLPLSFTRVLGRHESAARLEYLGAYAGDNLQWSRFALTYGLRLDATWYGSRGSSAPAVAAHGWGERLRPPATLSLMPRVGFAVGVSPRVSLSGGFGGFAGLPPLNSLLGSWGQTGTADSTLSCIGPAAPTPNWSQYERDAANVPARCGGSNSTFSSQAPGLTLFDRGYQGPRNWRGSVHVGGNVTPRLGAFADLMLARTLSLPTAVDLNLSPLPYFALAQESGRPVFAPVQRIDPATGGIAADAARPDVSLGPVLALDGRGTANLAQLVFGVTGMTRSQITYGLAYTATASSMLAGGLPAPGGEGATTAGDPARLDRFASPYVRPHLFQLTAMKCLETNRFCFGTVASLASGVPFTPSVDRDINGDGQANDRAFVFDPAHATDPAFARDLATLLSDAPTGIRHCLARQLGRIAAPASCRTGWMPQLDVRANLRVLGAAHTPGAPAPRLALSLIGSNVTAALDQLLHGGAQLRGWGQYVTPDATLLQVRRFDPETHTFAYAVNPHFGRPVPGLRSPFRVTLEGRFTLEDPRYQPLMARIGADLGQTREQVRSQIARRLPNAPAVILQLSRGDSAVLSLTPDQVQRLSSAADSLAASFTAAADALAGSLGGGAARTALGRARLHERVSAAQALIEAGIECARHILDQRQWAALPAWVLRPPAEESLVQPPTLSGTVRAPSIY